MIARQSPYTALSAALALRLLLRLVFGLVLGLVRVRVRVSFGGELKREYQTLLSCLAEPSVS